MENFEFQNSTKIIFGKDSENKVGDIAKNYGNKVLLHYDGDSSKDNFIRKFGLYDRLMESFEKEKIDIVELCGVKPNPRVSLVREGIELCRKEKVDLILAVGGGSVIDSAKAIGLGVPYNGDVWDFFTKDIEIKKTLPTGVVLTIAATGSETSGGSVITDKETQDKRFVVDNLLRPKFAILNPELTFTLPKVQTFAGVADIMSHVMERYFTKVENVELTDRLCEATLKTAINNAKILLKEPQDYNARAEIMWAGTIAHNDLLDTGRIGDYASHLIEHELSGLYDITHGIGMAVIFPAWMKYVINEDVERFAQFASRVMDVGVNYKNLKETALRGVDRLVDFFKSIEIPTTLKEIKITEDSFEEIASRSVKDGPIGAFKELKKEDVLSILNLAMK